MDKVQSAFLSERQEKSSNDLFMVANIYLLIICFIWTDLAHTTYVQ